MKVHWNADVPAEVRSWLEPLIERWEPALPRWLETLFVSWSREGEGTMGTLVRHEYRSVTLFVYPGILEYECRSSVVLHEFIHVSLDPLHSAFHALLEATVEEGSPLWKWAQEACRTGLEGATNDLEAAVLRLVPPGV